MSENTNFNEIAVINFQTAIVKEGGKVTNNRHGVSPLFMTTIAGKNFNKQFLDGTIAANLGITSGETILIQVSEGEESLEYGRQPTYVKLSNQLSGSEIIDNKLKLGSPILIPVKEEINSKTNILEPNEEFQNEMNQ